MNKVAVVLALGAAVIMLTYLYITHIPIYVSVYGGSVDPVAQVSASQYSATITISGVVSTSPDRASYVSFKFGGDGSKLAVEPYVTYSGTYSAFALTLVQKLETRYPVDVYICRSSGDREWVGTYSYYTYTGRVVYNGTLYWDLLCLSYTVKDDYVGRLTNYITFFNATYGKSGTIGLAYRVVRR